ncbi:phage tail protein [Pseudomonas sp. C11]|uniref:phage tail protein n=1 Tax=Pseudomonas sp. C11 TaxID=3075550 RepID=UPI002AFEDA30|nr:tail fiber protein [Pseudomonas sp. C11]
MDAYVGQIRLFAGNYAPKDWAFCNGAIINISDNEILYSLIGTAYGGDGKTNFMLPDLRGRLPLHIGKGPQTTTNYTLGQTVGAETVTITTSNLPTHNHAVNATAVAATQTSPEGEPLLGKSEPGFYMPKTATDFTPLQMDNAALEEAPGGNEPHNNYMPTIAMNYIICTVGLYPNFQ